MYEFRKKLLVPFFFFQKYLAQQIKYSSQNDSILMTRRVYKNSKLVNTVLGNIMKFELKTKLKHLIIGRSMLRQLMLRES